MYQSIISSVRKSMEKSLQFFKDELQKIRAGRANINLVSDLLVDYYGTKTSIKQLATISTPEPRLILISPFDKNSIREIEKTILTSSQDLNPQNDGRIIRISISPLSEERRNKIAQIVSQKLEETRNALRNIREENWRKVREMEEKRQITEDDRYKAKDELNELIDEFNRKAEEIAEKKKEEVMKI